MFHKKKKKQDKKNKKTSSSLESSQSRKSQQQKVIQTRAAAAKMKSVGWCDPDSFLPPHFGFLDRPEVGVVDHAVLAGLGGGNDPTGRQHGVLFFSSRIILEDKLVEYRKE